MPYQPLEMEYLVKATEELDTYFASFSKRFVPPSLDDLCIGILGQKENAAKKIPKINDLKTEYETAVRSKLGFFSSKKPDSTRLAQIACIKQTTEETLNTKVIDSREWENRAQQIILGSIIYRLLRIDNNYSGKLIKPLWGRAEDNSALQNLLLRLLKVENKDALDFRTIISTCTAYQSYLNSGRVKEGYSYIKDNPTYLPDLDTLITQTESRMPDHERQCELYIQFIKSIPPLLEKCEQLVEAACDAWVPVLRKDRDEAGAMDKKQLVASLAATRPDPDALALMTAIIAPETVLTPETEIELMIASIKSYLSTYYQFALLGAYVVSLNMADRLPAYFADTLNFAIKSKGDNLLDNQNRKLALTALDWVLKAVPNAAVNCRAWGGIERFKAELLLQVSRALDQGSSAVEPESEASSSLSL
ncbi:hypothetical protein [Legionella sp. CNM-4043-24]|uniref:hypothetical protein n=1 Tax=Legionella sp. CNM-4043-24 TaxID=3421646 RepID=UPI00403A9054